MTGYNELAKLMGACPELAIFRRFGALDAKDLLYRQAELQYLEEKLNMISDLDTNKYGFDQCWKAMHEAPPETGADKQRKLVELMQTKKREYYKTLESSAKIQSLVAPNCRSLSVLRECLECGTSTKDLLDLIEADPWEPFNTRDLVTICSEGVGDGLAVFLESKLVPFYHRYVGPRSAAVAGVAYKKVWYYRGKHLALLGNILCIILSAGINIASIVAMRMVSSVQMRLVMMSIFCLAFAVATRFIAAGRQVDVFAATTAFAAVQAVFAGGVNNMVSTKGGSRM